MTDIPEDVLKLAREMRDGLEGVTEGPWRPSKFGFQIVSDFPSMAWQSVVELRTTATSYPHVENEAKSQQAIAEHLARCSPVNIRPLLDAIDNLIADRAAQAERMARLEEALKPFAAEAKHLCSGSQADRWKSLGEAGHYIGEEAFLEAARALSQEGSDA